MLSTFHLRMTAISMLSLPIAGLMLTSPRANLVAQPTYKLDVKPHLKPLASIKLTGGKISRTDLDDDPGFRLQYHIKQLDGKSVNTIEARSNPNVPVPNATAGNFTVVLELFYPAYKGGTSQKGEFKEVSNVVGYKVEGGKLTPIDLPPPKKEPDPKAKDKK
jgi:hypothetical protein